MNTLSIVSLCISILPLTLTFLRDFNNSKREKSNAIIKYLNEGDSDEMKNLRKVLYLKSKKIKDDDNFRNEITKCYQNRSEQKNCENNEVYDLEVKITKIISFYDKWALLYNKKNLPKWALEGPRETTFLEICDIVMFYIEYRRNRLECENYADDLFKLYNKKKKL